MSVQCGPALIGLSTLYFTLHLGIYLLALRRLSAFRSERGILLYHLIAAIVFSALVLLLGSTCAEPSALTTSTGLIFAHGIYSLSFLELWSLVQGGYSITLLLRVMHSGSVPSSQLHEELAIVGQRKKRDRLTALADLGLLRRQGELLQLTTVGRLLSHALKCLVWIANPEDTG